MIMAESESELKTIISSYIKFYDESLNSIMSGGKTTIELVVDLDGWVFQYQADLPVGTDFINKISDAKLEFDGVVENFSGDLNTNDLFQVLKTLESSKDKLLILLDDLVVKIKIQNKEKSNNESNTIQFDKCALSNSSPEDMDLVFSNLGTQEQRAMMIDKIATMEYERAIQLLTLLICLLSKMDRDVDAINEDFDKVSSLRNTLVDIEMHFVANETKKEQGEIETCQAKIERQLSSSQEEEMYADWLGRLKD